MGQTAQFFATVTLGDGTKQDQTLATTWSSSNTAVATVSGSGLVTAVENGAATIAATFSGQTATTIANVALTCRTNNTAKVSFQNLSRATVQNVIYDGVQITQLQPAQTSEQFTTVAGIAHTLLFRDAANRGGGCSQATPILAQCSDRLFTCSF